MYNLITNTGNQNHFGVRNQLISTGAGNKYGVFNSISALNANTVFGTYNFVDGGSTGDRYGVFNQISNSGSGRLYGSYTNLSGTGTGIKFGDYITIASTVPGTHYGVYSDVNKPGSFAGYFKGRLAVGTTDFTSSSPDYYIFPEMRGGAGQVLRTDANGVITWQNLSVSDMADGDGDTSITVDNGTDNDEVQIRTNGTTEMVLNQADFIVGSSQKAYNASLNNSSRMFFDKQKSAFRGGFSSDSGWNDSNVGMDSFSFGYRTLATGQGSVAFGADTESTGNGSLSNGFRSKAMGAYSIASGYETQAIGDYSVSMGFNTYATHSHASVFGNGTASSGDASFTVGQYNVPISSALFVIGNGTSPTSRNNALVVDTNGKVIVDDLTSTARQNVEVLADGTLVAASKTKTIRLLGINAVPVDETTVFRASSNGGLYIVSSIPSFFRIPVNLPVGASIKRITVQYKDRVNPNLQISLLKSTITIQDQNIYQINSPSSSTTYQTFPSTLLSLPVDSFTNYVFSLRLEDAGDELFGIEIEYIEP